MQARDSGGGGGEGRLRKEGEGEMEKRGILKYTGTS